MSFSARQVPSKRSLVVASVRDRADIEGGPFEGLVAYLDRERRGSTPTLHNTFPLLGVAFSDRGEAELGERLAAVRGLATVPEVPIHRVDRNAAAATAALIRTLVEGSIGRL